MKIDRFIRVAIAVTVLIAFIVATGALLFVTESALNVWDRLADGPAFLLYAYVAIIFHREILKDGAMPLSMLESKVDRWVESQL